MSGHMDLPPNSNDITSESLAGQASVLESPDGLNVILVDNTNAYFNDVEIATANNKMKRLDNDVWEIAVIDVPYYSPDQHGGYFGTVYRRYHGARVHGASITITGLTKVINFAGIWNTINTYNGFLYDGTNTIRILKGTNQIDFVIIGGATLTEGWIDYVV